VPVIPVPISAGHQRQPWRDTFDCPPGCRIQPAGRQVGFGQRHGRRKLLPRRSGPRPLALSAVRSACPRISMAEEGASLASSAKTPPGSMARSRLRGRGAGGEPAGEGPAGWVRGDDCSARRRPSVAGWPGRARSRRGRIGRRRQGPGLIGCPGRRREWADEDHDRDLDAAFLARAGLGTAPGRCGPPMPAAGTYEARS